MWHPFSHVLLLTASLSIGCMPIGHLGSTLLIRNYFMWVKLTSKLHPCSFADKKIYLVINHKMISLIHKNFTSPQSTPHLLFPSSKPDRLNPGGRREKGKMADLFWTCSSTARFQLLCRVRKRDFRV